MSSWSDYLSFSRAKKNKEDLEKTNPDKPVLNNEDEQFLQKITSQEAAAPALPDAGTTKITDSGEEKEATEEEKKQAGAGADQVALPETKPETKDVDEKGSDGEKEAEKGKDVPEDAPEDAAEKTEAVAQEASKTADAPEDSAKKTKQTAQEASTKVDAPEESTEKTEQVAQEASKAQEDVDDPPEVTPDASAPTQKKSKKSTGMELPSQEEAEAATRGFNAQDPPPEADKPQAKGWASYLPSLGRGGKQPATDATSEQKDAEKSHEGETEEQKQQRTWASYAAQYVPSSLPSLPSLPSFGKGKDSQPEPVYNEDGTINEEKTKEKEEREVSVLLDKLNLSAINNRVFSFSTESQKVYERFTVVLKDVINGGPTAYEDMEKLMQESGPQMEKMFASMPPFVQTLVKSLPAKLGSTMGPELLAAMSEKPGNDMKAQMEASNKKRAAGGDASINAASAESSKDGQKQKRKMPGLKSLISEQGAVASMLRNVVTFLRVRFPLLMSGTNVLMSLAVFILMFVFWYCHKRGKETRLAREHDAKEVAGEEGDDFEESDIEENGEAVDNEKESAETADDSAEPASVAEQGDSTEATESKAAEAGNDSTEAAPVAEQEDSTEATEAKAAEEKTEDKPEESTEAAETKAEIEQNLKDFDEPDEGKETSLEQPEPKVVPLPEKDHPEGAKGADLEAEKAVGA